jgi:hypothetical protein
VAYTRFEDIPNFSAAAVQAAKGFIDPTFYNDDILTSPIITQSATFDAIAQAGSPETSVPFLNPLDASIEENVASPDESILAEIHGITGGSQSARLNYKDQVWGSNPLLTTHRGIDVMAEIAARDERYWVERRKTHLVTVLSAIATTAGANFTVNGGTNVASVDLLIDGKGMFGDAQAKATTVVMHSTQQRYLSKGQLGFVAPADSNTLFGTVHGMNIVVSDSMPVGLIAIVAEEAFSYGEANLGSYAMRYEASERAARGWGTDILVSRKQYILHPQGFRFVGAVDPKNASPTIAEMNNGNDWELLAGINPKQVPFRFVKVAATPPVAGA